MDGGVSAAGAVFQTENCADAGALSLWSYIRIDGDWLWYFQKQLKWQRRQV